MLRNSSQPEGSSPDVYCLLARKGIYQAVEDIELQTKMSHQKVRQGVNTVVPVRAL